MCVFIKYVYYPSFGSKEIPGRGGGVRSHEMGPTSQRWGEGEKLYLKFLCVFVIDMCIILVLPLKRY